MHKYPGKNADRDKLLRTGIDYTAAMMPRRILLIYYAATALFLVLDYVLSLNVRLAFLESQPLGKALYYGLLLACLVAVILRPDWTLIIGAVESLVTLVGLIFNMALRSMVITDAMIETGVGVVTPEEIVNFLLAGSIAYASWTRRVQALTGKADRLR